MPSSPHTKIAIAWLIFGSLGVAGFIYAKTSVYDNREEAIKVRQQLRERLEAEKREAKKNEAN